jgi:hypothetical protein
MRALDLGCGNGLFCCMLCSGGVGQAVGVDYADSAVELAQGVGKLRRRRRRLRRRLVVMRFCRSGECSPQLQKSSASLCRLTCWGGAHLPPPRWRAMAALSTWFTTAGCWTAWPWCSSPPPLSRI